VSSAKDRVKVFSPKSLGVGDKSSLVRYRITGEGSQPEGYADVLSIKAGVCVAALLVLVENAGPPDSISSQMSEKATELLGPPANEW